MSLKLHNMSCVSWIGCQLNLFYQASMNDAHWYFFCIDTKQDKSQRHSILKHESMIPLLFPNICHLLVAVYRFSEGGRECRRQRRAPSLFLRSKLIPRRCRGLFHKSIARLFLLQCPLSCIPRLGQEGSPRAPCCHQWSLGYISGQRNRYP